MEKVSGTGASSWQLEPCRQFYSETVRRIQISISSDSTSRTTQRRSPAAARPQVSGSPERGVPIGELHGHKSARRVQRLSTIREIGDVKPGEGVCSLVLKYFLSRFRSCFEVTLEFWKYKSRLTDQNFMKGSREHEPQAIIGIIMRAAACSTRIFRSSNTRFLILGQRK